MTYIKLSMVTTHKLSCYAAAAKLGNGGQNNIYGNAGQNGILRECCSDLYLSALINLISPPAAAVLTVNTRSVANLCR